MGKTPVVDLRKSINDLLKVIPGYLLLQPSSLAQNHEQIRLVGWEHKVSIDEAFEDHFVCVETFDHIRVFDLSEDLLLVLCLIDLAVELLVELHNHLGSARLLRLFFLGTSD
jgi:hypothetical protein